MVALLAFAKLAWNDPEGIMESEKYEDMKRREEHRTRWIWRRQQQKEDACQQPAI